MKVEALIRLLKEQDPNADVVMLMNGYWVGTPMLVRPRRDDDGDFAVEGDVVVYLCD